MDEITRAKKELRKKILNQRSLIPPEILGPHSKLITEKIKGLPDFKTSALIMCYVDFGNEVRTKDFIKFCLHAGKRVAVPFIMKYPDGRREMKASELLDLDQDLESGAMGILEPKADRRRFVEASEIDFIVVPGLAFDLTKNRLGYGAGFYDRFFKQVREDCRKVALAFDFQVFEKIPINDYDIIVDKIITETRIIQ